MVDYKRLLVATMALSGTLCAPLNPTFSDSIATIADCFDYQIPVKTETEALTWALPRFSENYDVANFYASLIRRTSGPDIIPFKPFSGSQNVTGYYTIGATFCSPKNSTSRDKTVLLATHGLGFDRRYWIPNMNESEYSFAKYAVAEGYSVFMYDRLGTGLSTKVSGYSDPQFSTHLAILKSLTNSLRSGDYTAAIGKPTNVIHVGHSFGSILSHGFITQYPSESDGVVLTGIGFNASDFPAFFKASRLNIANTVAPKKWKGLDSGYLAFADIFGLVAGFFNPASFDGEALWYANYIAQPPATIEFLPPVEGTVGPTNFSGPVMLITGELDMGNCAGNCNGILEYSTRKVFSKAKPFLTAVHPNAGHGFNFNPNATGAYGVIVDFLAESGF